MRPHTPNGHTRHFYSAGRDRDKIMGMGPARSHKVKDLKSRALRAYIKMSSKVVCVSDPQCWRGGDVWIPGTHWAASFVIGDFQVKVRIKREG